MYGMNVLRAFWLNAWDKTAEERSIQTLNSLTFDLIKKTKESTAGGLRAFRVYFLQELL